MHLMAMTMGMNALLTVCYIVVSTHLNRPDKLYPFKSGKKTPIGSRDSVSNGLLALVAQMDVSPTGDQEVVG